MLPLCAVKFLIFSSISLFSAGSKPWMLKSSVTLSELNISCLLKAPCQFVRQRSCLLINSSSWQENNWPVHTTLGWTNDSQRNTSAQTLQSFHTETNLVMSAALDTLNSTGVLRCNEKHENWTENSSVQETCGDTGEMYSKIARCALELYIIVEKMRDSMQKCGNESNDLQHKMTELQVHLDKLLCSVFVVFDELRPAMKCVSEQLDTHHFPVQTHCAGRMLWNCQFLNKLLDVMDEAKKFASKIASPHH